MLCHRNEPHASAVLNIGDACVNSALLSSEILQPTHCSNVYLPTYANTSQRDLMVLEGVTSLPDLCPSDELSDWQEAYQDCIPRLPGHTKLIIRVKAASVYANVQAASAQANVLLMRQLSLHHVIGTEALTCLGFPEAVFVSIPSSCPQCTACMGSMRLMDVIGTRLHLQLNTGCAPASLASLFLVKGTQYHHIFLSKIRPFLTLLPALRTYKFAGPARAGTLVYRIDRSIACENLGPIEGFMCYLRAFLIKPLLTVHIIASYLQPLHAPQTSFGQSRLRHAAFLLPNGTEHNEYSVVSLHGLSTKMHAASRLACRLRRQHRLGWQYRGNNDWVGYMPELSPARLDFLAELILDFLVVPATTRVRSRASRYCLIPYQLRSQ